MKTTITVNRHVTAKNKKTGAREPVLSIKTWRETRYANRVEILGPSVLVYSPDKPLSCGATTFLETRSEVRICAPEAAPAVTPAAFAAANAAYCDNW